MEKLQNFCHFKCHTPSLQPYRLGFQILFSPNNINYFDINILRCVRHKLRKVKFMFL